MSKSLYNAKSGGLNILRRETTGRTVTSAHDDMLSGRWSKVVECMLDVCRSCAW